MKLNIRTQTAQSQHNNSPIVLAHGLSNSLNNLGVLARDLVNDHNIIQAGMRNHSLPPRDPIMNCPAMAQDLVDTLDVQQIDKVTFISHSMGGKAVMAPTVLAPDRIDKLVVIDIAPVDYYVRRHDEILAAINVANESDVQTHQQAAAIMRQHLNEEGVIQLLLESFVGGGRRFNVPVLRNQYSHTVGWEKTPVRDHPALFIPGGNSSYVSEQYRGDLLAQFPQTRAYTVAGAGHWVHAEKPDAVLHAICRYLND